MNPLSKPDRSILQIYSPKAQRQFASWSAATRLRWLDEINRLYWAAYRGEIAAACVVREPRPKP
ncbi:MAG: hypothetical protein COR54_00180 [Elusimicrobia bacterium CG22_combo_CG10-13_8_21_14_all_63_91]|nr:MAG: hypothetical protein COR54_00180 [Elusimicrobia bacterium CG22_combo_CG10-13_8_21_14_all_63_91]